jgi:hypothetical protein
MPKFSRGVMVYCVEMLGSLSRIYWLTVPVVVDCAPDSKKYNMKCDFVISRDALEAPCS